ncbi:hypothetical protein GCM10009785_06050 [Brooklawnia cerclae]|uniref:Transcriptional regulator, AbiEi antitoxin, Type IV TA system n=1 Tax=Brooklawnia cerclae TaxID=349934 RepID=A0ABX0SCV8_9ACTN|nr:hypothetical protein [Brooklawnia cerclae]NIH55801.1 hypothetical protein [Brooklawnia cerclae]
MDTLRYTELMDAGLSPADVRSMVRDGALSHPRHGGYLRGALPDDPDARHLVLVRTTLPALGPGAVLSHASAAVMWGLPVPRRLLGRVHVTRDRASGGRATKTLWTHARPLRDDDVVELQGMRVTSLARTVIDLAGLCEPDEALWVVDAGWRLLTSSEPLRDEAALGRRRGSRTIAWALDHADPLAESPGESESRYWMITCGVPRPLLQHEIRDDAGRLLARADFAWPDLGVLGEFDGLVKYGRLVPPGRTARDVIAQEKRRENRLLRQEWWIHRWMWDDLRDGPGFARDLCDLLERRAWAVGGRPSFPRA